MTGRGAPTQPIDVTSYGSVDEVPADAADAAGYHRHGELFRSIEWFRCLQESVFTEADDPRTYVARDPHGTPLGLLACTSPHGSRELRGMSNFYSLEFGPAIAPGASSDRSAVIEALIARAVSDRPRWTTVRLDALRSDRSDTDDLESALRRLGYITRRSRQSENWYLDVDGADFASYFAARPSQVRNTISRKEKKLRAQHDLAIEITRGDEPALDRSIDAFTRVYDRSWKGPEPHPAFIPSLIEMCARLSILRLGIAYVDDVPAAAQLWINSGDRTYIYKLAYDEDFASHSVGAILSRELFRNAIDVDRVREIDYGVGSEPYKRQWMSGVRTLEGVAAYDRRSLGGLSHLAWSAARSTAGSLRRRIRSS